MDGDGPSFIKVGRSVFYDLEAVDAWLLSHTVEPKQPRRRPAKQEVER
jgi:hypothetical protein